MYVDKLNNGAISIMEVTPSEAYVLTEALIRFASDSAQPARERDRARRIAIKISHEK